MRTATRQHSFIGAAATLVLGACTLLFANLASAADGTIKFTLYKAGFVVGGSGGNGTLTFQGKDYPLVVGGVSIGATIGIAKAELVGEITGLKTVADVEGIFGAGQASAAFVKGTAAAELSNSKGVVIRVRGAEKGVDLSLDLSGMKIALKK
jgi:lipid-binding SYLF domain-containing protein